VATASILGRSEVRVQPQDLEAETSVLGAILLDQAAMTRVLDFLNPEDFYRENNAQIYRAALNLFREGEPIDNVTLAAELEKLGVLERIGGRAHLAWIQEAVPTAANVEHYARIVKDKAYKRRLISAGGQVTALGFDDSLDAEEAVNQAQSHVYAISDDKIGSGLERIYDLLKPAMDRIDAQMASGGAVIGIPSGFHDIDRMTNGFKQSDLIVIAGRPSMGKCLSGGMLVDDPQTGERITIKECVERRLGQVWSIDGDGSVSRARVADWVDSGVKECSRVRTRTGRLVEVTHHHPFLTAAGWQPLHELIVGDRIAVPRSVPCFGQDTSLSLELVRLIGYCVAGGSLFRQLEFTSNDPDVVSDFEAIVTTSFAGTLVRQSGTHVYLAGTGRPNPPVRWLRSLGLWGKLAECKRFPDFAWRWDRPRLAEFVRAVMSCEGTVHRTSCCPRIEFSVASRRLAEDMRHALTRFGVVSKLWRKGARCWTVEITEPESVDIYQRNIGWVGEKACGLGGKLVQGRRSNLDQPPVRVWTLLGTSAALQRLGPAAFARATGERGSEVSGFQRAGRRAPILGDRHLARLAGPDLYWDEIVSIESIGKQQVYDLTVPDGANFIAQDVVVHNTSFVLNVALHAAIDHKKPVAIFSLEMSKEQLVERMLCEQARIDAQRLHRGTLSDVEYERLAGALGPLGDAPIFIDDSPALDDLTMRLKARQARSREGIELMVVDYLQLMHGHSRGDDSNRVQEVSAISRALKSIARELRVPVIACSQLSRAPEARPDKRPILSDLRESGSIEQDSDLVMFLYRDEYYNRDKTEKPGIAEVLIAKHRNGPTGMVELVFRKELTRFENLERRRPEAAGPEA
jgi:replicative DNA helicase